MNRFRSKKLFYILLFIFNAISLSVIFFYFVSLGTLNNTSVKTVGTPTSSPAINTLSVPNTLAKTSPTPFPTPASTKPKPKKELYRVAAIGDSMVETIGGNLDYIYKELRANYPETDFYMYNYGISSENVIEGAARFDEPFSHQDRSYPPLAEVSPDIIIIGSWAYNPPTEYDKNEHLSTLSEIIQKSKAITSKVYVLAEIAPLENDFGNGPGGVNWPPELIAPHVAKILELIENARSLPAVLDVDLIDVYSETTVKDTPYGYSNYVDPHDNIHPSAEGQIFTAEVVVSTIELD